MSNRASPQKSANRPWRQGPKTGSGYALALKHWQATRFGAARKCLVERGDILRTEHEVAGRGVVGGVFRARRFRDHEHIRFTRQICERDLARRGATPFDNGLQYRAAGARRLGKIVVTKRRIGNHRDAMLRAPWNHRVLDRALLQMIE